MESLLSTTQTARILGVAAASVKRWADSGLLSCVRTVGGHRRFRTSDVEAFRASPREGWVEFLLRVDDVHQVHARLLSERARHASWSETAESLIPAIVDLGLRWERGEIRVLDEHLASERLARGLSRAVESIPVVENAPLALLATSDDEDHTLGLSLSETVLREAGLATRWAGRRMPAGELAEALDLGDVDVVVVVASSLRTASSLGKAARILGAAGRRASMPVVLGGSGPWPAAVPGTVRLETFPALAEWASHVGGASAPARGSRARTRRGSK